MKTIRTEETKTVNVKGKAIKVPYKITPTISRNGYILTVFCLCYLMCNHNVRESYNEIRDLTQIKSFSELIRWYMEITRYQNSLEVDDKVNTENLINAIFALRTSMVIRACVSLISDMVAKGKYVQHIFPVAKGIYEASESVINPQILVLDKSNIERVRFDGFNVNDFHRLAELYVFDGELNTAKAIWSVMCDTVLFTFSSLKPDLNISSAGSKSALVPVLKFDKLKWTEEDDIYFVDCCARTAILPLNSHEFFTKIYLNEKDEKFYTYLLMMKMYPLYTIEAICNFQCDKTFIEMCNRGKSKNKKISGEARAELKEFFINSCRYYSDNIKESIALAAAVFWWVRYSFSGSFNSGIQRFCHDMTSRIPNMLSASLVLQKAEISKKDCVTFAKPFMSMLNAFVLWDVPYAGLFGSVDQTYNNMKSKRTKAADIVDSTREVIPDLKPFKMEKIDAILKMTVNAKCKSIFTHSLAFEVDSSCYTSGMEYLFEYAGKFCGNTYITNVYSYNIDEEDFVNLDNSRMMNIDGEEKHSAYINEDKRNLYNTHAAELKRLKAAAADTKKGGEQ